MKAVYAHGDQWRHDSGPVAAPSSADTLFYLQRYHGGALVLYALRQSASQVSGRTLTGFLRDCLYGTKTPAMPGHPDWKVDPGRGEPAADAVSPRTARPRLATRYRSSTRKHHAGLALNVDG
jgi:hypothetical protein